MEHQQDKLTILGPALNGINIIGLLASFAVRFGSKNLSGLNVSASAPHRSGLRCISSGMYMIGVLPGMYSVSFGTGTNGCACAGSFAVYAGMREGGSETAGTRDSRMLSGTGGKSRRVSLRTARTEFRCSD